MNHINTSGSRDFSLDLLRVLACYLVINQHASEFYYIGPNLSVIRGINTFWVGIITSFGRICVPLFIMISGYFLLPMKDTTANFFRKRVTRVLWPFLFWCVAYALYYVFYRGDTMEQFLVNVAHIPVNFAVEVGHLWFVYMLIGVYLLVPIISPWLKSCSRTELRVYLLLWAATGFIPYIHLLSPLFQGECSWNPTPLFYYFYGFAGYFVLGYYIKRYGALSIAKSLVLMAAGYAMTAWIFCSMIETAKDAVELELGWGFCTINVVMIAYGFFSIIKHVKCTGHSLVGRLVTDISINSYGIYLAHIMMLNFYHDLLACYFTTTLLSVPVITLCTFVTVYVLVRLLSLVPSSKWWLG